MTRPAGSLPRRGGRRPPHGQPVVDRALSLLTAFDATHERLTLAELSRRSGIPSSSAQRLAMRLVAWGALERDDVGCYSVGLRLFEVASLAPRARGLRKVAIPFMGDLAEVTRHHVMLAVRDGDEALLVELLSSHNAVAPLYPAVGARLPLHSTGVGLVLLAFAHHEFQEQILGRPLVHEPEQVPLSAAALRRHLAGIRREGVATVKRRVPQPTVSVAAPIFNPSGEVRAGLSVLVPDRAGDSRVLVPAVRTAARGITRGLAGQP